MNDVERFKHFVQTRPDFMNLVHSGRYSWQQLYELYVLYGENHEVWLNLDKKETNSSFSDLLQLIKSMDIDTLVSGMQGLEKILDLLAGYLERSPNQFFDD